MKKNMEQLIFVCKVLLYLCGSYKISSIRPKGSIAYFFQKKYMVPLKKLLVRFFSNYRLWHTSSNFLLGSTKISWQLWCKLWDHFLNTQEAVENMCYRKMLSFQWTFCFHRFCLVIEHGERQGTTYKGTEGIPTLIGRVVRSFL